MTTTTIHFTKAALTDLQPGKVRDFYLDSKEARLGLYVTTTGHKSFFAKLVVDRKTVRRKLGNFPDMPLPMARKKAIQAAAVVAGGSDPLAEQRKQEAVKQEQLSSKTTLQEVFDEYIKAKKQLKPGTIKDYRQAIKDTASLWLNKPLAAITEDMVRSRYAEQGAHSSARTANGFRVLGAVFNFARVVYKRDDNISYFPDNPVDILKTAKIKFAKVVRSTKLEVEQFPLLWNEVHSWQDATARRYLIFVLTTGCRNKEAASLKWEHVNLKAGTFRLVDPKNKRQIDLPLPDTVQASLREVEQKDGYVFPSVTGGHGGYIDSRVFMRKLKSAVGSNITLHDLRRTFVSLANSLDISFYTVKWLVNHKQSGNDVTAGYDVADMARLKAASLKIEAKILQRVQL